MENIQDKVAEVELAYRPTQKPGQRLETSIDCFQFLLNRCFSESSINHHEEVKAVYLNSSLKILGWSTICKGGINTCLVDVRLILQTSLLMNATYVLLAHNHPSDSIRPSREDDQLTDRVKKACDAVNINLLDHLIISPESYFSYNDEGRL